MVRLQRKTSFLCLLLIVVSLAAAGLGFGWYVMSGLVASIGTPSAEPLTGSNEITYGIVWTRVYLASLAAGLLLIVFSAKGTRLICLTGILLAALGSPLLTVIAAQWV